MRGFITLFMPFHFHPIVLFTRVFKKNKSSIHALDNKILRVNSLTKLLKGLKPVWFPNTSQGAILKSDPL